MDVRKDSEITITPDPQILQILSYLEMRPIDSLCELIDNAIDALSEVAPSEGPLVIIDVPSRKDVEDGTAIVRVRDNGPGMTVQQVENALRAGYSSKPQTGRLGLFGVGFNIATGKLGRVTRLITARSNDKNATEVVVDLESLRRAGNFKVRALEVPKPSGLEHGTVVEVTSPWGTNNQNHGFMLKLVSIGRPKILANLGRIYATLLRGKKVRILLGPDAAKPFYHCIWSDVRFVDHGKHGKIPAVIRFENKVIHSYLRCASCGSTVSSGETSCPDPTCKSASLLTQEERVSGWVGIQRYSDASHFGIDLIRNGRAIRLLEKSAFFEFQDPETGNPIFDYPVDNREGRIVGEVHLNHVPVDPAKQNFERSSPEWRRAMSFIRGDSSLQPERPGAEANESPVFRLYQGYRKVRGCGRRSMNMGKWAPGSNEPRLLTKAEIEQLKKKFEDGEPGYFDDAEWWKLVEEADNKPVAGLIKCSSCHLDVPEGLEECPHCSHVFQGKNCINKNCGKVIVVSAITCPSCGANQVPEIQTPWRCDVCQFHNSAEFAACSSCSYPRGTPNPVSKDSLLAASKRDDHLSVSGLTISMASGTTSSPLDVVVFICDRPIQVFHSDGLRVRLPSVRIVTTEITIFVDPTHPLFDRAGVSLEQHIAYETAAYLYSYYQALADKNPEEHSLTRIAHEILLKCWPNKYSADEVGAELDSLFATIRARLVESMSGESEDIYANLSQEERAHLASEIVRSGRDISELAEMKGSGQFLHFLRPRGVCEVFRFDSTLFFDKRVWDVTYAAIPSIQPEGGEALQAQIRNEYLSILNVAAVFSEKGIENPGEIDLAQAACKLLSSKLVG